MEGVSGFPLSAQMHILPLVLVFFFFFASSERPLGCPLSLGSLSYLVLGVSRLSESHFSSPVALPLLLKLPDAVAVLCKKDFECPNYRPALVGQGIRLQLLAPRTSSLAINDRI